MALLSHFWLQPSRQRTCNEHRIFCKLYEQIVARLRPIWFYTNQTKLRCPDFVALQGLVPRKNTLHLYPESPQKLRPNVQLNAPAPRINSRIFFLVKAKGNNKDRFAHHLKVANRSFSVAQTSPARAGAQRSEREKGGDFAPGDSKGRSPWRAFGDFRRETKVTRVQGGAPALEEQGLPSLQNPPGWRGGAPPRGECRGAAPLAYSGS